MHTHELISALNTRVKEGIDQAKDAMANGVSREEYLELKGGIAALKKVQTALKEAFDILHEGDDDD
jgi:hypothetical protein